LIQVIENPPKSPFRKGGLCAPFAVTARSVGRGRFETCPIWVIRQRAGSKPAPTSVTGAEAGPSNIKSPGRLTLRALFQILLGAGFKPAIAFLEINYQAALEADQRIDSTVRIDEERLSAPNY
jgi:hypothetical protein